MRKPLAALVLAVACAAPSEAAAVRLDPARFFPFEEVRPGMRGTGRTAFRGQSIESFEFEVLSLMPRAGPGSDVILARLSGPVVGEAGNMSGMSGSPVYLDGRLAGAVSFAYPWATEPLAGITPIAEMLALWELPEAPEPVRLPRGTAELAAHTFADLVSVLGFAPPAAPRLAAGDLQPIPLALAGSGGLGRVLAGVLGGAWMPASAGGWFESTDEGVGVAARQGGARHAVPLRPEGAGGPAGLDATALAAALEPGSPLSLLLVDGDMTAGAVGTLTYRDGDRVLAFGHPVFGGGGAGLPLAGAMVHMVVASRQLSFKMASPLAPLGCVTQDRNAGAAGRLGPVPRMIPVTVHVESPVSCSRRFRLAEHPGLTPILAAALVGNSLENQAAGPGDLLYRSRVRFRLTGLGEFEFEDLQFTRGGPFDAAAGALEPLALLYAAAFERVPLEELEIRIGVEPSAGAYVLESAACARTMLRPGEDLEIALRLRPYGEEPYVRRLSLMLPPDLAPGPLTIQVLDRAASFQYEAWRSPGAPDRRSLAGLTDLLRRLAPACELRIVAARPSGGLGVAGREFARLPARLGRLLRAAPGSGDLQPVGQTPLAEQRLRLPSEVRGQATFQIQVVKP